MHELRILVLSFDPPFSTKNILIIHMIFERTTLRIIYNKPWLLTNTISHILHMLYTCTDTEGKILLVTFIDMWISTFLSPVVLMLWYSCRAMRREECRSWYNEITTIHQHQHQSMHKTSVRGNGTFLFPIYCEYPSALLRFTNYLLVRLLVLGPLKGFDG